MDVCFLLTDLFVFHYPYSRTGPQIEIWYEGRVHDVLSLLKQKT